MKTVNLFIINVVTRLSVIRKLLFEILSFDNQTESTS